MTEEQVEILSRINCRGSVAPDTFKGRGYIVAGLVRRGFLEWERALMPRYTKATGLAITEAGRAALGQSTQVRE